MLKPPSDEDHHQTSGITFVGIRETLDWNARVIVWDAGMHLAIEPDCIVGTGDEKRADWVVPKV